MNNRPIGVFDSGVGGLTVVKQILNILPNEKIIYFGDTARAPYGPRKPEEIKVFVKEIMDFLVSKDVKTIVMACNTSSALVLPYLQKEQFNIPVIGMIIPAVKGAVTTTKNNNIGVMANSVTVKSGAYPNNFKNIDKNFSVYQTECPLLVPFAEKGIFEGEDVDNALYEYLLPLKLNNIDTLIFGCTHYPLFEKAIRKIMGFDIEFIDPAFKTALELKDTLKKANIEADPINTGNKIDFYCSGDSSIFENIANKIFKNFKGKIMQLAVI